MKLITKSAKVNSMSVRIQMRYGGGSMGNKLFVRQMKRTVACVAAAATVFSMNPAGLPYAGGQAGAFVVDAATESTAVEISTYEQFAAFAKAW